jgi:hypothetical protein
MHYVLVIILTGAGGPALDRIEFNTLAECQTARSELAREFKRHQGAGDSLEGVRYLIPDCKPLG